MHPDFLQELSRRFSGELRFDPASRVLYSTDASMYQIEPLGVAIPRTQDDLHAAVELAAKYSVPILPRGAGTSLAGQAVGEALILDCSRYLDAIVEIDASSHSASVEPGVVLSNLNRAAAVHGLMFGPDPASAARATMGGVIGNNATGAHSILYGMSADHLISADVILADGTLETWDQSGRSIFSASVSDIREKHAAAIKQNSPRSWRNSAGYRLNYLLPWSPSIPPQWDPQDYGLSTAVYRDSSAVNLASLLAGSEGTLAVMRRARVNLVPVPRHTILGVLAYASIAEACDDVPRLLDFRPSAIELIPRLIIRLARAIPAYARQLGWVIGDPAAVLVVEFSGDNPDELKSAVRNIGAVLTLAESIQDQAQIWNIRKVGLGILDSGDAAARPAAFIEDCAIPVGRLGEFVREVERILGEYRMEGGIYAHASAGCSHIRPMIDLKTREGVQGLRAIAQQVLELTLRLGGSMSSEHGDGIARGAWIEKTYGRELAEAMRQLKQAADPQHLLNPAKLFDAPPMDTHLRYGEKYLAQPWTPSLDFKHQLGLAGAIEQCNGLGACRKENGVMCPSFQATREEAFSTRGRANLLRGLIAGPHSLKRGRVDMSDRFSSSVYEALDLCLACKGCTSECPSGVDMPKLKYEFMHEYYKTHARPLRDYLFAYFHVLSGLLAPIAPLANAVMKMDWSRALIAAASGISPHRPLPLYARRSTRKAQRAARREGGTVLFLSDVATRYFEPEVEDAAIRILHAAGYNVKLLPLIGAGAQFLSKGFIGAARRHAGKVLDAINAVDPAHSVSIVGCEPPEVYCLKHEYFSLLPARRAEIEKITGRVWLVEEFLLRVANSGATGTSKPFPADLKLAPHINLNKKISFHPHCHQRAEGPASDGLPNGTQATLDLLGAFGFDVDLMEAGCCGMAGTFGFDEEHYDLSMQVGELGVFPKARAADVIVSTGSACRMHIGHGTQQTAVHPLVLISERLAATSAS